MNVPELLQAARGRAVLSQQELATRAGTSQPALSRYESGTSSPSVATLERLLAAAGAHLELSLSAAVPPLDVRHGRMARLRAERARVRAAARRHGASNVRVFGSVVRGEDREDSDVDLLVDMDVRRRGLFPLDDLRLELQEILDERVDLVASQLLDPRVAERALAEAVPL